MCDDRQSRLRNIICLQVGSELWEHWIPAHEPGKMQRPKMAYREAYQARRGTVAVDRNVSHAALLPLCRPPPAHASAPPPPPPVRSLQIQQEMLPTEVKDILSARKTAESPLCLRQIAGKGIVGNRR